MQLLGAHHVTSQRPPPRAPVTGCILRPTPAMVTERSSSTPRAHRSPTADTTASGHVLKPTRGPEVQDPPSPARSDDLGCFRLHDFVTARTSQLLPNLPDHFEMFRYILQCFRNIFTELFQLAAAVRDDASWASAEPCASHVADALAVAAVHVSPFDSQLGQPSE